MKSRRKNQTKSKMFASYVAIPVLILTVISCLFSSAYYQMAQRRNLAFENTVSENVNEQLKGVMDNLLKSAVQYSMTPWVRRLKYMQKIPNMTQKSITASDILDYASTVSLAEINENLVESIYIYYSLEGFGISSIGRVTWNEYTDIYGITCEEERFQSGKVLNENNQQSIYHHVSMTKNGKHTDGFFLIQTIPMENTYNGEVNILFYVSYDALCDYIRKFADDGTEQFYLTDGQEVLCGLVGGMEDMKRIGKGQRTEAYEKAQLWPGESIRELKSEERGFFYRKSLGKYVSEYTKAGMAIGALQILDPDSLHSDFFSFLKWIVAGYVVLFVLIVLVASRLTKRSYQPLEHIMDLIDEKDWENFDEYQLIERTLKEFYSQKELLDVSVYEQNPLVEQYLLHGLLNQERLRLDEVKYVNTMRKYAGFRCLVLKDSMEVRQYMGEIDACLAVYPQIHAASLKEESCYIWVLSYGEESLMEEIGDTLEQTFTEMNYREAVMAMSGRYEDLLRMPEAIREAVCTLSYHYFYPEKKLLLYDGDFIGEREQGGEVFEITDEAMKELQEKVEGLQPQAVAAVYRQIAWHNFRDRMLSRENWFAGIHELNEYVAELFRRSGRAEALEHMELLEPENFGSLDSYLQTFEIKTAQLMERCACRENPMYAVRNQMIRQYVEEHLTDANLSLSETARVTHYTSTYFGKYFKEQFGCAFQQYVAVRRIECAKKYLLEDQERRNKSIQEIALACGFTNDVTFRRTFKRYTGVTPSQFGKGM